MRGHPTSSSHASLSRPFFIINIEWLLMKITGGLCLLKIYNILAVAITIFPLMFDVRSLSASHILIMVVAAWVNEIWYGVGTMKWPFRKSHFDHKYFTLCWAMLSKYSARSQILNLVEMVFMFKSGFEIFSRNIKTKRNGK